MMDAETAWLERFAQANRYLHIKRLPARPGWYGCLHVFAYTVAIIAGRIGDEWSVGDRWCFAHWNLAQAALDAWDGLGEPEGWHRHPASGRRRPEGNAALEYVNQ